MRVKSLVQDPILNVVEIVNILIRDMILLRPEMVVMGDIIIVFKDVKICIVAALRDARLRLTKKKCSF